MSAKTLFLSAAFMALSFSLAAEDYPINYDGSSIVGSRYSRTSSSMSLSGSADGDQTVNVNQGTDKKLYQAPFDKCFTARPGETLTAVIATNGTWVHHYVYLDFGQDGQFDATIGDDGVPTAGSDLLTYSCYQGRNSLGTTLSSTNTQTMPAFTLPADMKPGVYRLRFKVDWNSIDPGGSTADNNDIVGNGGMIADVPLLVHDPEETSFSLTSENGVLTDMDGNEIPSVIPMGKTLYVRAVANEGYIFDHIDITYGLADATPIHGTPTQWAATVSAADFFMGEGQIPGNMLVGEVTANAVFVVDDGTVKGRFEDRGYSLIWHDEFNTPDGSLPDFTNKWAYSDRKSVTWARFNSPVDDLYTIENGCCVLKGRANDDTASDDVPFITGAMETNGKFAFTHGIVEARLKTLPHSGNFPAFWLMPQVRSNGGWPYCGEIDIFEQINTETRSWHTLHAYWSANGGGKYNTYACNTSEFHVYTFEWEPEVFKWYVDDNLVFTFYKSSYTSSQYPWPFDDHFYIIFDQAVGDGSWASNYDSSFTYKMSIDYVRVYQKEENIYTGIENVKAETLPAATITGGTGVLFVKTQRPMDVDIFDISGRLVKRVFVDGDLTLSVAPGFYITGGSKAIVK